MFLFCLICFIAEHEVKSFLSGSQRQKLSRYSLLQCKEAIGLFERRIKQLTNADYQSWLEKSILDLSLSTRAITVLSGAKILTVGDLFDFGIDKIETLRNCGQKTIKEIKDVIENDKPVK